MRLALIDEPALIEELGPIYKKNGQINPVNLENEMKMMRLIKKMCYEKLGKFKTTKLGDEDIFYGDEELTENEKNILGVIYEEKVSLENILNWAEGILDKFYMEKEEAIKIIEGLTIGPYLKETLLPLLKSEE